jgi:cytoskeletal protein CcmA (bactofilin family)
MGKTHMFGRKKDTIESAPGKRDNLVKQDGPSKLDTLSKPAAAAAAPEPVHDDIPPMPVGFQATALKPAPRLASSQGTPMSNSDSPSPTAFRPEIPRRGTDIPGASRPTPATPIRHDGPDPKTLIVGREISLHGEITSCDRLVVEGKVEAALSDCQTIEIAESGLVKGAAEVGEADIRGRFEGKLTVRGRLLIRSAGKVAGEIRYGQLEIECGGQITGQIESTADRNIAQARITPGVAVGE